MKQTILAIGFLLGSFLSANAQVAIGAYNSACEPITISIDAYYYDGTDCSYILNADGGTVPAHSNTTFYVPSTDPGNPLAVFNTYAATFTVCNGAQGGYVVANPDPFISAPYCVDATGNYGFMIDCNIDPECGNQPGRTFDLSLGGFPHPDYIIHYH